MSISKRERPCTAPTYLSAKRYIECADVINSASLLFIVPIIVKVCFGLWRWWRVSRNISKLEFSFCQLAFDFRCRENSIVTAKCLEISQKIGKPEFFEKFTNTDVVSQSGTCNRSVNEAIVVNGDGIISSPPEILRLTFKPGADFVVILRTFALTRVAMLHFLPSLFIELFSEWEIMSADKKLTQVRLLEADGLTGLVSKWPGEDE